MQGTLIRSRANVIENGEKPSQFFCNLETQNYTNKTITVIEKDDGQTITGQKEILNETKNYYKDLFTSKENILIDVVLNDYMQNMQIPTLNYEESSEIEGKLTLKEAGQTLKNMKNNKSPGTSGFSVEFFKTFWKQLGSFVVRAINFGFDQGELSVTQQQGLIVCIPKENKCRKKLKNWRPITLLNTIYKIASGSIANRIKQVLNKLISTDQTGFIAGRFIGENTRLMYDILHFTEEQNIPGLILLIDFEKAFDSLSWSFIDKVLKLFNFGPNIRQWINVFYKNCCSAVTQCSCLSEFFKLGRGCRQGDPISPYLFILCAEILSIRIRNNENIKGIKIDNTEFKFSQYADDASAFLDGSKTSLEQTLEELEKFAEISGLKTNFDKTQVVWIGAKKYSIDSIKTRWKLSWGANNFKLLGITFDVDLNIIIKENYYNKIKQIKNSLKVWNRRFLTPLGKITVVKSLMLPKITHLLMSLPNPETELLEEINRMFFDFIWNGRSKIKQSVVIKQYFEGGLKMVNIMAFAQALKITWIRRMLQNQSKWQLLIKQVVEMDKIIFCGSEYTKLLLTKIKNPFWKDVLKAVLNFQLQLDVNWNKKCSFQTPIFHNKNLTIGGKSFFYKSWFNKGVCYIRDLVDNQGNFLELNDFMQNTTIETNFLQYHGVIECLRKFLKGKNINEINNNMIGPVIPHIVSTLLKHKKGSQNIYTVLNQNKDEPTGKIKWNQKYNIEEKSWQHIFQAPFEIAKCTKLRWFQTTINHRIYTTNKLLFQMNLITSPNCSFCGNTDETIDHLFWKCPKTQSFIRDMKSRFQENSIMLPLDEETFILGNFSPNVSNTLQFLMLVAKYYIGINRSSKRLLNFPEYRINVLSLFQSLRAMALQNSNLQEFLQTWQKFKKVFNYDFQ